MTNYQIAVRGGSWGDESKGATVDYLADRFGAGLVVRDTGGANAGHTVVLRNFKWHTFNQWGSGTFRGAKTYLAPNFRVAPFYLVPEAAHLQQVGVKDPYGMLMVSEDCLVTTPYHTANSQYQAPVHGLGTTGCGVGDTIRYAEEFGHDAIKMRDLLDPPLLREKLHKMESYYAEAATTFALIQSMSDPVEDMVRLMTDVAERVQIIHRSLWPELRDASGTVIYEGSQGYGLDRTYGTVPYVTSSDVTYNHFDELTGDIDADRKIRVLCLRMYATRQGAGPFPTEDVALDVLPEIHNATHEFQGKFRRGWFDLDMTRNAIRDLGGIDYIAMSHLDYFKRIPTWRVMDDTGLCFATNNEESYLDFIRQELDAKIGILAYGPRKEDRRNGQGTV